MGDIHDDLREVMGLLGDIVPRQKPLPDLLLATYHEARGWNACREAMLALIRQHGPALLARQEGEETITFGGVTSRFVDGMGWVIACSDVPHYMRGMVEKMSTARSGGGG